MLTGLYISAAGMAAQETRQSVISNNLANAQTTGFKRDLAVMQSRANASSEDPRMMRYQIPVLKKQSGGVNIVGAGIDLKQGALIGTGNDTDLALDGKGFFTVQGQKPGEKVLTRDGSFLINNDGLLVTAATGRPVLSASGQTISLDKKLPVAVYATGRIAQGDNDGIQLGIVDADPRKLVKLGDNLLTVDEPESLKSAPAETQVRQNTLESSGVDPIIEMVNMMEGQRAFEANAKLISYQDTTLSELNTIGKIA